MEADPVILMFTNTLRDFAVATQEKQSDGGVGNDEAWLKLGDPPAQR